MNKRILLLFALVLTVGTSMAQTTRYFAGYVDWAGSYTDSLVVMDEVAGSYNVVEHRHLTSDAGDVDGCYGLTTDFVSGDMYILYQLTTSGSDERRLGILDTLTAAITDIGVCGNITDIAFSTDGTLYGTTGYSSPDFAFVEISTSDASVTELFVHLNGDYGPSIGFDPFNNRMLKMDYYIVTMIDLGTMTETEVMTVTNQPGEIHAIYVVNDSMAIVMNYEDMYTFNMNTGAFSASPIESYTEPYHALANGSLLLTLVDGPHEFCDNDPSTLSVSLTGTNYQWMLDGNPIPGATNPTYVPVASGFYTCDLDGKVSFGNEITITTAPVASFTTDPNPVSLVFDLTGTVTFINTSTGGDTYAWDFGNGFTTSMEDPEFPYTSEGDYTVVFTVTDSQTGCTSTASTTISVVNNVGVEELEFASQFNIYPSPASDVLTIDYTLDMQQEYSASLVDLSGRVIETQKLNAQGTTTFNVSKLNGGVYLVKVAGANGESAEFRVVKY